MSRFPCRVSFALTGLTHFVGRLTQGVARRLALPWAIICRAFCFARLKLGSNIAASTAMTVRSSTRLKACRAEDTRQTERAGNGSAKVHNHCHFGKPEGSGEHTRPRVSCSAPSPNTFSRLSRLTDTKRFSAPFSGRRGADQCSRWRLRSPSLLRGENGSLSPSEVRV